MWISPSSPLLPEDKSTAVCSDWSCCLTTRRSQVQFSPCFFPQPKRHADWAALHCRRMWMRTQMLLTFLFCNRLNILPKTAPSYSIFEGLETVGVTIYNNHTENLELCRWHESFHNPFSSSLQLKQTAQSESARFGAVIKRSQDREENLKHFVYRSWLMGEVRTSVVVLKEKCKMLKRCKMTSFIH